MEEEDVVEHIYGEALVDTKEIRTVKTTMRTLYDWEKLDSMRRAKADSVDEDTKEFIRRRWEIAYALMQVDHASFEDEDVIDKYNRIMRMPSIVVDALYMRLSELNYLELESLNLLGESGGTQDQTRN